MSTDKTEQALPPSVERIMGLADTMAMRYAARDIPTGKLYRDIAERQWQEARAELRAALAAAPPVQPVASTPYASALADVTAAWVPFSRRLEIAEKVGTVVDAQFNEIVREVVQYMLLKNDSPPPVPEAHQRSSFSSALRGLVESLSRTPIPEELRFAAHELTVMADRISAKARRGEDEDA